MHKIGSGKHKISNQQTIHTIFLLFYACFIADGRCSYCRIHIPLNIIMSKK
jgi:hypothetical protein